MINTLQNRGDAIEGASGKSPEESTSKASNISHNISSHDQTSHDANTLDLLEGDELSQLESLLMVR